MTDIENGLAGLDAALRTMMREVVKEELARFRADEKGYLAESSAPVEEPAVALVPVRPNVTMRSNGRSYSNVHHQSLVADLLREGMSGTGFRANLERAVGHGLSFRLVPDAHRIDEEERTVEVHEVEVTHSMSENKLERYLRLYWALDEHDWELRVFVVNRFGQRSELDMFRRLCTALTKGHPA